MSFFTPELFGISIGYHAGILNQYDDSITSNDEYPLGSGELWQPQGMELINNTDTKPIRIFHSACNVIGIWGPKMAASGPDQILMIS